MIILVGENNPYGGDPYYALYDDPPSSAGGRLRRLILRVSEQEYLDERNFKRLNLLQRPKWSAPAAREAAAELLLAHPEGRFVLLGRKVFDAFTSTKIGNLPKVTHEWTPFAVYGERLLAMPHPSGLNRFWHESGSFDRAHDAITRFRCSPS